MSELIKPKEVQVKDVDGNLHTFTISRLPATVGREVLAKYTFSNMPKAGDYQQSQEVLVLLMSYVAKHVDDLEIRLKTQSLIDNHVPDAEALLRLEIEMMRYNTSFFANGSASSLLDLALEKIADALPKIIETLTRSLPQ